MKAAALPDNEQERLQALLRYAILDTSPEAAFEELTQLASQICEVPIALVSLVDTHRQWFKARVGLGVSETPRELAFCAHAILQDEVFEVPNAREDPRFADNPLVAGAPDIRFYAGAPLVTNDGFKLGTLCVIDRVPRQLRPDQVSALRVLGRQVVAQMELRKLAGTLARSLSALHASRTSANSAHVEEQGLDSGERQRALLAHATHDLRTPLNAILGFAQLIAEEGAMDEPERRELAGRIDDAAGYMLRLVNDILAVAQLDSGAVGLAYAPIHLSALASATLETIRPLAVAGGNHVELVATATRRTITGDSTQIQKILFNLLSNACKYTREGTIRLTIDDDGDRWVRIAVADTGIGMTADQRRRLFRPFVQVHNAKVQDQESTGLGLHITRGLCERMGGALTVGGEAGVGTTFTAWLSVEAPTAAPHGKAIAIAEGDPDVRAALRRALGREAPLVFIEGVAEVLWTLVDQRWRGVILDSTALGADDAQLVHAVARMCGEASTPLVVAAGDSAGPETGTLPRWSIHDAPAALHRLLGLTPSASED